MRGKGAIWALTALLAAFGAGYAFGHENGRWDGKRELGPGISQAAQNGYEGGLADGAEAKPEEEPEGLRL